MTRLLDVTMVACALILTVLVVRRELFQGADGRRGVRDVRVANWPALASGGHAIGAATAEVSIVEFSDFQCPYCRNFATKVWPGARSRHGDAIRLVYRHWPLSVHPFSVPAAIAAECAGEQGRFERFHNALFEQQDSIGAWDLDRFAAIAGIPDSHAFSRCRLDPKTRARVEADRAMALGLGARGTPTFVVNGVLLAGGLDAARIDSLVSARKR